MASHTWEQTNKEVVLLLPVLPDVRGKEVRFFGPTVLLQAEDWRGRRALLWHGRWRG